MLSMLPIDLKKVAKDFTNREILRVAAIAELDAVSLYEQLAEASDDPNIKKVLLDIAKEEKTHFGEFLEMLLRLDQQQKEELQEGKKEVEELVGKK
ncbi:MAG: ferritin family protein [Candidatus Korarchaeota archaeon]